MSFSTRCAIFRVHSQRVQAVCGRLISSWRELCRRALSSFMRNTGPLFALLQLSFLLSTHKPGETYTATMETTKCQRITISTGPWETAYLTASSPQTAPATVCSAANYHMVSLTAACANKILLLRIMWICLSVACESTPEMVRNQLI